MLPLGELWYRRLLVLALGLGLAGGLLGLAYHVVTAFGIDRLFGEPTSDPWSGRWWWIPLIAGGAVLVVFLRRRTGVSHKVPGAVAMARVGWVEPGTAPQLFVLSALSLMLGASLGPSFGVVVAAGGLGSWFIARRGDADPDEKQDTALSGMAGGLGALFAAPLFASIMASELSPTPKRGYVAAFIPQFIAATVGFAVFFGITGSAMLGTFDVAEYTFRYWHLLAAVGLGLIAVAVVATQVAVAALVERLAGVFSNDYLKAAALGAMVGAIAFALPLTATGGQAQLAWETDHLRQLGVGLLLAVLIGKMLAFSLSQAAGFLGGAVFPMLFIGGTAGALVHAVVPEIPATLAIATMLAAVPGAIIGAPVSFILIGVGTVAAGIEAIPPLGIAVVVAHLGMAALQRRRAGPEV